MWERVHFLLFLGVYFGFFSGVCEGVFLLGEVDPSILPLLWLNFGSLLALYSLYTDWKSREVTHVR